MRRTHTHLDGTVPQSDSQLPAKKVVLQVMREIAASGEGDPLVILSRITARSEAHQHAGSGMLKRRTMMPKRQVITMPAAGALKNQISCQ